MDERHVVICSYTVAESGEPFLSAKKAGLEVHPYTFRTDKGRIPAYANDFNDMMDIFYHQVKVDGVFTDFPDKAVEFLNGK